jgi:hypothetical protein
MTGGLHMDSRESVGPHQANGAPPVAAGLAHAAHDIANLQPLVALRLHQLPQLLIFLRLPGSLHSAKQCGPDMQ